MEGKGDEKGTHIFLACYVPGTSFPRAQKKKHIDSLSSSFFKMSKQVSRSEIPVPEHQRAKRYPFSSRALVYFWVPQGLCPCCPSTSVALSHDVQRDPSPPSFRSSPTRLTWYKFHPVTLLPDIILCFFTVILCINTPYLLFWVLSPLTKV